MTENLNYVSKIVLEAYKRVVSDETYIIEKEIELQKYKSKYEALDAIFDMDAKVYKAFSKEIRVSVSDLNALKRVLQNI